MSEEEEYTLEVRRKVNSFLKRTQPVKRETKPSSQPSMSVSERDKSLVMGRVNRLWIPRRTTHHLIIGESGSGKTGLIRDVIMPLCASDRVLWIDVKNDTDNMLDGWGIPLDYGEVLEAFTGEPDWYRLVVDPIAETSKSRKAIEQALELSLEIGDIILACDETRTITESGQLGLHVPYEKLLTRGRSNGVSVISTFAATDNIYSAVKTQWSFAWVGSVNGTQVVENTLKILGLDHRVGPKTERNPYPEILRNLEQYQWLYLDKAGMAGRRRCLARVRSWNPDI